MPGTTLAVFVLTALAGYGLARLVRLPMPHLLGPLGLSLILHVSGLLDVPRISEFVILAQVSIGGAVGARLSKVPFRDVFVYIADALVSAVILLLVYALATAGLHLLFGLDLLSLWLAFVPGGLYEVTLLALLFGFDVAFVAVHHTIRIVFIILSLPVMIPWLTKARQTSKTASGRNGQLSDGGLMMKLNEAQREEFDKEGYLFFPGLFTPDRSPPAKS